MNLTLDPTVAEGYTSKSQRSRVITETWAEENLYCLNCDIERITPHRPGKRVEDFHCRACDRRIQLKAARDGHGSTVTNSGYEAKMEAIEANAAPDYAFMGFSPEVWQVTELFVVPGHFMTPTVVEARNPLGEDARRSGWVGSNILLDRVPSTGRISIVEDGEVVSPSVVRRQFEQTAFLEGKDVQARDWTTAVMDCIDELAVRPGDRFELGEVYEFEDELAELYPDNEHIRAKIRQQLQVLRDQGLVEFLGDGVYRLKWVDDRDL